MSPAIESRMLTHGESAAIYEHRCVECVTVWQSDSAYEARCPFCGTGQEDDA